MPLRFFALAALLGAASHPLVAQDVRVRVVNDVWMAAAPDSNSPAFWRDGRLFWYGSVGAPWLSHGADQFGPWETRNITIRSADPAPKWIEAVWPEHDRLLWTWYHTEPEDMFPDSNLTVPKVGAAVSFDGGYTLNDLGIVLASGEPSDPGAENGFFAGGHGDPCVILDRERKYFYFFFGNYGGPDESQGVGVARMAFDSRGQPAGKVWKYHDGKWQEPGLGGRVTPIFPVRHRWGASDPDAFWGPAVHWNRHLNCYVMLLNHAAGDGWRQEGIYISYNTDLSRPENWTSPRKILDNSELPHSTSFYPQVMGLGPGDTDRTAGETARLYVYGSSWWEIDFIPAATAPTAVTVTASPATEPITAGEPVSLSVTAMGQRPFTYQWFKDGNAILNAISDKFELASTTTADSGAYTVVVTNSLGAASSGIVALAIQPAPPPSPAFLSNFSVHSWLDGNGGGLDLGFSLTGGEARPMIVRAIGPTLLQLGVPDAATDPRLTVFDGAGVVVAENDNWTPADGAAFAAVGAFPLPDGSADAGVTVSASPGASAARVSATASGMVLAEVYDPAASVTSRIAQAWARGPVVAHSDGLVCGFNVSGSASRRLLIRALGPQLAALGIGDALPAPQLEIYDQTGAMIAANEGWDVTLASAHARAGAPPLAGGSLDAAVIMTVAAGNSYTVVVRSRDGATGNARIELYELP